MIRFILDFHSSDILVLGERLTERVDFYYLADFLQITLVDDEYVLSMPEIFGELLAYYKTLIEQADDDVFLIYDLSDQYIAAIHLEKFKFKGRPYWRITQKSTTDLSGFSVTKTVSIAELKSKNWRTDPHFSQYSNPDLLMKGILWSLENLRINSNPIDLPVA